MHFINIYRTSKHIGLLSFFDPFLIVPLVSWDVLYHRGVLWWHFTSKGKGILLFSFNAIIIFNNKFIKVPFFCILHKNSPCTGISDLIHSQFCPIGKISFQVNTLRIRCPYSKLVAILVIINLFLSSQKFKRFKMIANIKIIHFIDQASILD